MLHVVFAHLQESEALEVIIGQQRVARKPIGQCVRQIDELGPIPMSVAKCHVSRPMLWPLARPSKAVLDRAGAQLGIDRRLIIATIDDWLACAHVASLRRYHRGRPAQALDPVQLAVRV